MEKTGNGAMKRSEESITLMTAYRLPHYSHRFFAALRMTSYGLPYHGHRHFTFASDDALAVRCHSERRQKCRIRKQGSGNVTRSERSITLMTPYRLPHHGSRSFTFVQDDALAVRCHSERRQKCRIRKQESGHVKQSEESITLMGSRISYLWCCFLFSCI